MKLRSGLLAAIVFFVIIGSTSCVKEFICECEIVYSGEPGLPDTLINQYKVADTKKKAKQKCEAASSENEKDGIKAVETCKLY